MKDVYQTITDHIINSVDEAGAWKPCWHGMTSGRPTNVVSDHAYQGVNILTCWVAQMIHDYPTQQWATYKQWASIGGQVIKGSKGTPILFYSQLKSDNPDEDGRMFAKSSHVFNAAQVEGAMIPGADAPPREPLETIANIEAWLEQMKQSAVIQHSDEGRAYYRPSTDSIMLPHFDKFIDAEHYYTVAFHELTHWTGAKHRLDREFRREKTDYAKEELVAELGAAFLAADFGIEAVTRDDHTTYIASWLKALKNDKRLIVRAASLASKATEFLHYAVKETASLREAA